MAQSLNSKVDLTIKATSFEFYNERNVEDCIQIPWDTIDRVEASVLFNKSISRFVIFINEKTYFTFSTKDNKKTLRAIREYVPADRMLRSLSFWDVFKRGLMYIPNKLLHSNN